MLLPPGRAAQLLAAVLRITGGDDGIQVVAVLGVAESLKHRSHQALDSGAVSSLAMKPTMDRWSWPRRATSTRTVAGAVLDMAESVKHLQSPRSAAKSASGWLSRAVSPGVTTRRQPTPAPDPFVSRRALTRER